MTYIALRPEYHLREVYIEADSEEEAKELYADGDIEHGDSYYRHTIDVENLEIYDTDSPEWKDRERELIEIDATLRWSEVVAFTHKIIKR